MARVEIFVTDILRAGVSQDVQTDSDQANGMVVPAAADGLTFLEIESVDTTAYVVEVVASPDLNVDDLVVEPLQITVEAGDIVYAGPFRTNTFKQNADHDLYVDVPVDTTLKFRAYRLTLPQ